jgi:5'-deoxynucleotidase YfbR-like HD superfamily hydrolase
VRVELNVAELLEGPVRRLASVWRYAALRVSRAENVAEHSFYVALYALALARDLRRRGTDLDEVRVLRGALCHDLDESISGDLTRPYIAAIPGLRETLDAANARFVRGLARGLGFDAERDWGVQRERTLEGEVVAVADVLEIVAYIGAEVRAGNGHLRGVASEVRSGLFDLRDAVDPVLAYYLEEAQVWIERVSSGRTHRGVPGDREMIARTLEGIE